MTLPPASSTSNPPRRSIFKEIVVPILAVVSSAAVGAFTLFQQARNRDVDQQFKVVESEQKRRESDIAIKLKVYDAVVQSLATENRKQQDVALALVRTILPKGDTLQSSLLSVLGQSGNPEVREQANVALYHAEQFQVEQRVSQQTAAPAEVGHPGNVAEDMKNWDFDIFWCESSGQAARAAAEQIRTFMNDQGYGKNGKGLIRVRMLPISVNEQRGYHVDGIEIRQGPNEESQASIFRELAIRALADPGMSITIKPSSQRTPYYLSLFVCAP